MKIKLIYTLALCFCYFSMIAKGDDLPKIEDQPDFKKSLRTLFERAKASMNQPQEYLLDMGTVSTLAPTDLKDIAVNGAISMLDEPTKNAIVAKLDAFNAPTVGSTLGGWGGRNSTKMFAFTGKIILGYNDTRDKNFATSTEELDIMNALSDKLNAGKPQETVAKTFFQTIDDEWKAFKTSNGTNKTMVCFFVEAVLVRNDQTGSNVTRNNNYKPGSKINNSYFVLVWEDGLEALDWYKVNNDDAKTALKMTYDQQNGFTEKTEFPTFIQKIHDLLGANLVLDTPEKVSKFINDTYNKNKSVLESIDATTRIQLLHTLDKANSLNDCVLNPVQSFCGENALLKLFETTPPSQYSNILTELKAKSKKNTDKILLTSLCDKTEDALIIGQNTYGKLIGYVNKFVLATTTFDASTLTSDKLVCYTDEPNYGDHLNTIEVDNKSGKVTVKRDMVTSINIETGVRIPFGEPFLTTTHEPFELIFVSSQNYLSVFGDAEITNSVVGTYNGVPYQGSVVTAYTLTYMQKKWRYKQATDAVIVAASIVSIVTGPGAIAAAVEAANYSKVGMVAFEMATSAGNLSKSAGIIEAGSPADFVLNACNGVLAAYGAGQLVNGTFTRAGSVLESFNKAKTQFNALSKAERIEKVKDFVRTFQEKGTALVNQQYYPKLETFYQSCLKILKDIGQESKLLKSELNNYVNGFKFLATPGTNTAINLIAITKVLTREVASITPEAGAFSTGIVVEEISGTGTAFFKSTNTTSTIVGYTAAQIDELVNNGGKNIKSLVSRNNDWKKTVLGNPIFYYDGATLPTPLPSLTGRASVSMVAYVNDKLVPRGLALTVEANAPSVTEPMLAYSSVSATAELVKEKEVQNCTICKANNNATVCTQAVALNLKTGKTSEIETICTKLISANPRLANIYLKLNSTTFTAAEASQFLIDAAMTAPATDPDHLANASQLKLLTDLQMDSWQNLYSTHKGTTKAKYARVDTKALTKWKFLNSTAKDNITNFSDNASSGTTQPTLKKFTGYLDANDQGTENDNFNLFINANPDVTEAFVGHKLLAEGREIPFYTTFYDFFQEKISQLPLQSNVYDKAKYWLDYSEESAKRGSYFKQGKDFEEWIGTQFEEQARKAPNDPENYVYTQVKAKINDLNERSIYTQVRFCISGNVPCDQKNQYFIADFVFARVIEDPIRFIKKVDIIIADTKLSMNTDFTDNQKLAQLTMYPTYNIWTNKPPIKGSPVNGFSTQQNVVRNASFLPFFKIYRGNVPKILGGIIP
jgi:hypothetical protein